MKINVGIFIFVLSALDVLIAPCYGDTATCRVLDPAGKPVANATVYVTDNPLGPTDAKTLTCDSSGKFSVDLDEFSQYNLCTADAPGFAPGTIMDLTPGDHTLSLLLPCQTGLFNVVDTWESRNHGPITPKIPLRGFRARSRCPPVQYSPSSGLRAGTLCLRHVMRRA